LSDAIEIPSWKNNRHEAFYYLNLIKEIEKKLLGTETVSDDFSAIDLRVSDERLIAAQEILEKNGVDLTKKTVALGVGSTNSNAKRWHAASFAKLNDLLQKETNCNVVLVGAKSEIDVSDEVFENSNIKPIVLTGKTSLSEVVALLAKIDLLISNDMGLAHIAPAVGTKTLVIFGPTNEKTTQPIGSEIIRKMPDCAPCMLRDCPIDHRCMTQISPFEVFEKAKNIFNAKTQRC
jgi:heptosyltransferase-2